MIKEYLTTSEIVGPLMVVEQVEENPFLSDFYKDREQYAFQTQLFFLLSRYRQQQELRQPDLFHRYIFTDYIFTKDRLFASLTLSDNEMLLYDQVFSILDTRVLKPDLVVYLRADENLRYAVVIHVMDLIKRAGIDRIGFVYVLPEEKAR